MDLVVFLILISFVVSGKLLLIWASNTSYPKFFFDYVPSLDCLCFEPGSYAGFLFPKYKGLVMPGIGVSIERLYRKYKGIENMVGKKNGLKKIMKKLLCISVFEKSLFKMFHLSICIELYSPNMF